MYMYVNSYFGYIYIYIYYTYTYIYICTHIFNSYYLGNINENLMYISDELCHTEQLNEGITYAKAFIKMSS